MRTTLVHRPSPWPHDVARSCSRRRTGEARSVRGICRRNCATSTPPWSTAKLGVVISVLAAIGAVVIDTATALPAQAIVLSVMTVAFVLSLQATARRPQP